MLRRAGKVAAGALAVSAAGTAWAVSRSREAAASEMQRARAVLSAAQLAGKRAVVVGGTSGIGEGIATSLARAQVSVTVVGRSSERGTGVVRKMRQAAGEGSSATFQFVPCDCFSLAAVEDCSAQILGALPSPPPEPARDAVAEPATGPGPLDFLVLTQGMATTQGFTPTAEGGLDQKLTLHVWSRAAFALHLLPAMRRAGDARLLTVLSAGVHSAYPNWHADPELSGGSYGLVNSANAAGMYNDIMVDGLSQDNSSFGDNDAGDSTDAGNAQAITFMHAAPGFVATNWGTEMPTALRWLVRVVQKLGRSADDCGTLLTSGLVAPLDDGERGGYRLLDQYGQPTAKPVDGHADAVAEVWAHIKAVVAAKASVQPATAAQPKKM